MRGVTRWTNPVRKGTSQVYTADAFSNIGRVASRYGANNETALSAYHSFQLSPHPSQNDLAVTPRSQMVQHHPQPGHVGDEPFASPVAQYTPRFLSRSVAEYPTPGPVSRPPLSMDGLYTFDVNDE